MEGRAQLVYHGLRLRERDIRSAGAADLIGKAGTDARVRHQSPTDRSRLCQGANWQRHEGTQSHRVNTEGRMKCLSSRRSRMACRCPRAVISVLTVGVGSADSGSGRGGSGRGGSSQSGGNRPAPAPLWRDLRPVGSPLVAVALSNARIGQSRVLACWHASGSFGGRLQRRAKRPRLVHRGDLRAHVLDPASLEVGCVPDVHCAR